ncbi:SAM-dependent methyltransferase [Crossiella equi]|uniref:SAM-dependent methyltransferase n=1 Tax=Crossiella equi TaxID=130796 RepID=A0ABS5AA07_9PSEU|nr:class I SAM-dependent methyltransferase [Crossiella equi]MBP2473034.1 SAM-dependent methyltransferase [Crossiella equi]
MEFDFDGLFGPDYLRLYGPDLDARADAETDLAWRLLDLRPGMRVLDLACGHGRIANRLAARGCEVTGLDRSPLFLERARADAAALGVHVDYHEGDMRELPWTGEFDRVVNWFTAFGYFPDEDNRRVLHEVHRALRPGGRLAMELMNLYWLLPNYREHMSAVHADGTKVVDEHRLDALTGQSLATRTVVRDGQTSVTRYLVRMFAYPELASWLREAGFRQVNGLGEDGTPLTAAHCRMVVVADR